MTLKDTYLKANFIAYLTRVLLTDAEKHELVFRQYDPFEWYVSYFPGYSEKQLEDIEARETGDTVRDLVT